MDALKSTCLWVTICFTIRPRLLHSVLAAICVRSRFGNHSGLTQPPKSCKFRGQRSCLTGLNHRALIIISLHLQHSPAFSPTKIPRSISPPLRTSLPPPQQWTHQRPPNQTSKLAWNNPRTPPPKPLKNRQKPKTFPQPLNPPSTTAANTTCPPPTVKKPQAPPSATATRAASKRKTFPDQTPRTTLMTPTRRVSKCTHLVKAMSRMQ